MSQITVAICTWNRSGLLDQTLTGLERLIIPEGVEWELLVVNNNCTDDTDRVVARHQCRLPLRLLYEPRNGKSNAANTALDLATGDLILWTDDDVLVDPNWIASLVEAARRYPDAAGFGGPTDPWFPEPPDPDMAEAFPQLRTGFCGQDHEQSEGILLADKMLVGANMAFRRSAVEGLRFNSTLGPAPKSIRSGGRRQIHSVGGGEEDAYIRELRARGGQIVWIPSMRVRHYVEPARMTLEYLDAYYESKGCENILAKGIPQGPRLLGVPRWIVRQWLQAEALRVANRLCLRHRSSYAWRRTARVFRGMIRGCQEAKDACQGPGDHAEANGAT